MSSCCQGESRRNPFEELARVSGMPARDNDEVMRWIDPDRIISCTLGAIARL